jgi:hypothetical protein
MNCSKCGAEIMFLKMQPSKRTPEPKANPIETEPVPNGNLVVSRERGLYRIASRDEIKTAFEEGKNLYISHFARCPGGKEFRKK